MNNAIEVEYRYRRSIKYKVSTFVFCMNFNCLRCKALLNVPGMDSMKRVLYKYGIIIIIIIL